MRSLQADAGQPGSNDGIGNQRAAILKAAIAARDRIGAVKSHCEALMSELRQHTSEGERSLLASEFVTLLDTHTAIPFLHPATESSLSQWQGLHKHKW